MIVDLFVLCDVFLEFCLGHSRFLLRNNVDQHFLFLLLSFILLDILSPPLVIFVVFLFDLLFDLIKKDSYRIFLLLLFDFYSLPPFDVSGQLRHSVLSSHHRSFLYSCLLYTSPSPRDLSTSRMPSSA